MNKQELLKLIENLDINKIESFDIEYTDYGTMNSSTRHLNWES